MNNFVKITLASLIFCAATQSPVSAAEGKEWKNPNSRLFDLFLRTNPVTLYRIHKSTREIQITSNTVKANQLKFVGSEEAAFVKKNLNQALTFVQPFINDIRGYKDLILPLLNESAANHGVKQSHMARFLTGKDELEIFTDREIRTVESLQTMLTEIQGFFADLFASLSKETKDAYKAFVASNSKK